MADSTNQGPTNQEGASLAEQIAAAEARALDTAAVRDLAAPAERELTGDEAAAALAAAFPSATDSLPTGMIEIEAEEFEALAMLGMTRRFKLGEGAAERVLALARRLVANENAVLADRAAATREEVGDGLHTGDDALLDAISAALGALEDAEDKDGIESARASLMEADRLRVNELRALGTSLQQDAHTASDLTPAELLRDLLQVLSKEAVFVLHDETATLAQLARIVELLDSSSCLAHLAALPLGYVEPFFVLRGQDAIAGKTVRFWAEQARKARAAGAKIEGAIRCAE
jgi:hypothetical protein